MDKGISKECQEMLVEIKTPTYPRSIEYHESERLTRLGGFLMTYGKQCRVTMSAQLTDEEKRRGLSYLLDQLTEASEKADIYLWIRDAESVCNQEQHLHI